MHTAVDAGWSAENTYYGQKVKGQRYNLTFIKTCQNICTPSVRDSILI